MEVLPLTKEELTSRYKSMLYLWKKNLKKISKCVNYGKVRDYCYFTGKYWNIAIL